MRLSRSDLLPSLGIVFSSVLWGLFWIPVRAIEQAGVPALWTGPVLFTCVTLIFLPVALLLLPATWLTIWPTTILSPARIGILFMTEAIVGIGSAAWLTDEPFGLREISGTLLIMGAALVEILRRPVQAGKFSRT